MPPDTNSRSSGWMSPWKPSNVPSNPPAGRPWISSRLSDQAICPVRMSQSQVPMRPAPRASRSRSSLARSDPSARRPLGIVGEHPQSPGEARPRRRTPGWSTCGSRPPSRPCTAAGTRNGRARPDAADPTSARPPTGSSSKVRSHGRPADHLLGGVAEHLGHLAIDQRRPLPGVDHPDAFVGHLDDLPITLLALPQAALGPPGVVDIDAGAEPADDPAVGVPHRRGVAAVPAILAVVPPDAKLDLIFDAGRARRPPRPVGCVRRRRDAGPPPSPVPASLRPSCRGSRGAAGCNNRRRPSGRADQTRSGSDSAKCRNDASIGWARSAGSSSPFRPARCFPPVPQGGRRMRASGGWTDRGYARAWSWPRRRAASTGGRAGGRGTPLRRRPATGDR